MFKKKKEKKSENCEFGGNNLWFEKDMYIQCKHYECSN